MNSSTRKKGRRKGLVINKKSSLSNKSLSVLNPASTSAKRKISNILKNNKNLAIALEDARSELSAKQKFIEGEMHHLQNIMQARMNILEMHSMLKTFIKIFDDTLLVLKIDDTKMSDIVVPFRSCDQFKKKVKSLAASIEKLPEELPSTERVTDICSDAMNEISSGETIHSKQNSSITEEKSEHFQDRIGNAARNDWQPLKVHVEALKVPDPIASNSLNTSPLPKSFNGIMRSCKDQEIDSTKIDSSKNRENSLTPKLNLPIIKPLSDSEVLPNLKASLCSVSVPSSSFCDKSPLKKSNSLVLSSKKVLSSKIPKIQNDVKKTRKVSRSTDIDISRCQKKISQQASVIAEKCALGPSHQKTFLGKNSVDSTPVLKPVEKFVEMEIVDENVSNVKDSAERDRRKTFVVKNSNILEEEETSQSSRRKTFVKKSADKSKKRKSTKNQTKTEVSSAIDKTCIDTETLSNINDCPSDRRKTFVKKPPDEIKANESSVFKRMTVILSDIKENDAIAETVSDVKSCDQSKKLSKQTALVSKASLPLESKGQMVILNDILKNSEGIETVSPVTESPCEQSETVLKESANRIKACNPVKNKRDTVALCDTVENFLNIVTTSTVPDSVCDQSNTLLKQSSGEIKSHESVKHKRQTVVLSDTSKTFPNTETVPPVPVSSSEQSKTLLKPSTDEIKACKSVKNIRKTAVLSKVNELCTNTEPVSEVTENLVENKLCPLSNEIKIPEGPQTVYSDTTEKSKNEEEINHVTINKTFESKTFSENPLKEGILQNVTYTNESTNVTCTKESDENSHKSEKSDENSQKLAELNLKLDDLKESAINSHTFKNSRLEKSVSIGVKENLIQDEKVGKEVKTCETICIQENVKLLPNNAISQNYTKNTISDHDNDILEKTERTQRQKQVSFQSFLESSSSELISDIDDLVLEPPPPLKSITVRKRISVSRKPKVFTFVSHKRKSVLKKKSVGKISQNSRNSESCSNKLKEISESNDTDLKNQDNPSHNNTVKNENNTKALKIFKFSSEEDESDSKINANCDVLCDREKMPCPPADSKITKMGKKDGHLSNNKENINVNIAQSTSPVIASEKLLNVIEYDEDKASCNSKNSKKKQNVTDSANNHVKPRKIKKSSKQKLKQIDPTLEDKELISSPAKSKHKVKNKKNKCNGKEEKCSASIPENNAIVIEAEVHPLPRFLNEQEAATINNENKEKLRLGKYNVSVVLNDIFESAGIDVLALTHNNILSSQKSKSPVKTPLTNNSRNILTSVEKVEDGNIKNLPENLPEIRTSKRNRGKNYAEPSLRKKLRR